MKLMTRYIALLFLFTLASCANKKRMTDAQGGKTTVDSVRVTEISKAHLDMIDATQVEYTWFSASGQGNIDWDGERMSARINVRILRDSIIWVQVQKLGFELGRMLVTPDSAFFINRFERTYSVYRTEEFLEEYKVSADFNMFSRVFTAGAYVPPMVHQSAVEQDGAILLQSDNGTTARLWFDDTSMLTRSQVRDPLAREWLSQYMDYKKLDTGQQYPFKRFNTIIMDGKPNYFDLEFQEIEIDVPQQFPFSIPSHYEKI